MNSRPQKKHTNRAIAEQKKVEAPRAPFDWAGWAVPVVGGIAGALAFVPVNWWFLAPVALALLFETLRRAPTPGAAFRRLLLGCWIMFFGAIQWLLTIRVYAPAEILGVLGIVMLAVYMAMWMALPLWAVRKWIWPTSLGMQLAAFGSVWLIAEWMRTLGRLANPLGLMAHTWAEQPALIQIASSLGELGVSLEIILFTAAIVCWVHALFLKDRRAITQACALSAVPIALVGLGMLFYFNWNVRISKFNSSWQHLNIAIIQPNVEQGWKLESYISWPEETPEHVQYRIDLCAKLAELNRRMVLNNRQPDWQLVVMPETSYTEMDFYTNDALKRRVGQLAKEAGNDILFGADRNMEPLGKKEVYNSAYMAHPDGTLDKMIYDKMRLVPFGEALPYFDLIPGFQDSVVGIGSFNEGTNTSLFESHSMKFGVLICFESTFSQMARMFANKGADFLTVITNDAWYGMSAGPRAHFDMSLLRAVETRRWVVRAANTGISAFITPAGTISQSIALGERGAISAAIPKSDVVTFFMRWGNTWLIGAAWLVLAIAAAMKLRRRRQA